MWPSAGGRRVIGSHVSTDLSCRSVLELNIESSHSSAVLFTSAALWPHRRDNEFEYFSAGINTVSHLLGSIEVMLLCAGSLLIMSDCSLPCYDQFTFIHIYRTSLKICELLKSIVGNEWVTSTFCFKCLLNLHLASPALMAGNMAKLQVWHKGN